jgi:hypothetical protein
MTAAQDPHCPGGRRTQRTFKSATQLLEVGLVAFQEVLLGRAPTTLQKVLGFVCTSYLMWTAVKRHKATEIRDPLQELSIWRSVIKMENDRHTFDFLTHSLWPSAPTRWASVPGQSAGKSDVVSSISDTSTLHEVDYYSLTSAFCDTSVLGNHMALSPTWDSGGLDTAYSHVDLDNLKSFPTLGDFQVYVDQLLSETASNDDLRFADFLNIPDLHENLTSRNRARAETDRTPPWQDVDVSPATTASNIQLASSLDPWASPDLSEPFISPQVLEEFLPPVKGPSAIEPVRSLREDAGSCNPPEGCAHYDTTQTILSILVGSLLVRAVLDFFRCKLPSPSSLPLLSTSEFILKDFRSFITSIRPSCRVFGLCTLAQWSRRDDTAAICTNSPCRGISRGVEPPDFRAPSCSTIHDKRAGGNHCSRRDTCAVGLDTVSEGDRGVHNPHRRGESLQLSPDNLLERVIS